MSLHMYKISIETNLNSSAYRYTVIVERLGESSQFMGRTLARLLTKAQRWILTDNKTAE